MEELAVFGVLVKVFPFVPRNVAPAGQRHIRILHAGKKDRSPVKDFYE